MGQRILVVDNSRAMLQSLQESLQKKGHEVETAIDGLSALEILETFRPEVILIDLVMPKIGGDKLCRVIRSMEGTEDVFLIILSAMISEQEFDYKSFGADACVAKGQLRDLECNIDKVLKIAAAKKREALPDTIVGVDSVYPREATRDLLSIKKHFETTIGNLADGFLELTAEGKIIYTNPAATNLFGIADEKLLSTDFLTLFEAPAAEFVGKVFSGLGDEPRIIGEDNPVVIKEKMVSISFLPINDSGQKSIIVILRDVTAQKMAEEALRKANQLLEIRVRNRTAQIEEMQGQLMEAAHIAGMADIASGILHNIGNLMTVVINSISGLEECVLKTGILEKMNSAFRDRTEDLEDFVREEPEKVKLVLESLLTLEMLVQRKEEKARHDSGILHKAISNIENVIVSQQKYAVDFFNQENLYLPEIADDALSLLANTLEKNKVAVTRSFAEVPIVSLPKSKLIHVLVNLIKNAIEAMAGIPPEERRLAFSIEMEEDSVLIRVADTGGGISWENLSKIFSRGFTTKTKGHGIGLYNCANSIAEMQGKLWAESAGDGKGSVFFIRLPLPKKAE